MPSTISTAEENRPSSSELGWLTTAIQFVDEAAASQLIDEAQVDKIFGLAFAALGSHEDCTSSVFLSPPSMMQQPSSHNIIAATFGEVELAGLCV